MIQGTEEWKIFKAGKVGCSRVKDILAKGKGVSRKNYMSDLIVETITGAPIPDKYKNSYMDHGNENEELARVDYQNVTLNMVEQDGFLLHPTIENFGYSPDGLIGENGLIEIKSRSTAIHIKIIKDGKIPGDAMTQMYSGMACTGREWCDYVSHDPRMPEGLQIYIKRVYRDEVEIANIEKEVKIFLIELGVEVKFLEEWRDKNENRN